MLDDEPTLLNKGAKPFKFMEKEINIDKGLKKCHLEHTLFKKDLELS